jgi:ferredoxin
LTEVERRMLWVRAGGRCTLCKKYLLEGDLSAHEVPLGEGAHIVGREDSVNSARGKHPTPVEDRDDIDNLLLACSSCHTEIDKKKVEGTLDVDLLRGFKRQHEADIKIQTGLLGDRRTAILRMAGTLRGDVMQLPRRAAAEAVIRCATRFPYFIESYDRQGVEIDLLDLDGEHPLDDGSYPAATRRIDTALTTRVLPGVRNGDIDHLSVFAIARVPLLVYLGAKLDDGIPVDVYQRHRSTDDWQWTDPQSPAGFDLAAPSGDDGGADAVLITNLSGTTPVADLPEALRDAPTWTISPDTGPAEDVFSSAAVLARFVETVRAFFTDLEGTHKHVERLHLVGALPLAGAIEFGRLLKSEGLRPVVVTYDRVDGVYLKALEV